VSTSGRPGRPAGTDGTTRERVRGAAREVFATEGYRGATMRAIATRAGVDIALLSHYFGNKDGLFAATLELPEEAYGLLAGALSGPLETQGERLTRGYLTLWEEPATSTQLQALARSALSNEGASERLRALLTGAITGLGTLISGRRTGFAFAMTQLLGVALGRHLIGVPQLVEPSLEEVVARTAPVVQLHLETPDR
jgi:AcrR family transcriptional regulator